MPISINPYMPLWHQVKGTESVYMRCEAQTNPHIQMIQCSMFSFWSWSWSGWLSWRLNQFSFYCGLELYCRNTEKFPNILSKIVWKKFNRHLWLIGGIFQHILPLFMKKTPFYTILTLKGQHEYHFCATFHFF